MNNLYIRKSKITIGDLKNMIEELPNDCILKYYERQNFNNMNGYENVTDLTIEVVENNCLIDI